MTLSRIAFLAVLPAAALAMTVPGVLTAAHAQTATPTPTTSGAPTQAPTTGATDPSKQYGVIVITRLPKSPSDTVGIKIMGAEKGTYSNFRVMLADDGTYVAGANRRITINNSGVGTGSLPAVPGGWKVGKTYIAYMSMDAADKYLPKASFVYRGSSTAPSTGAGKGNGKVTGLPSTGN